MLLAQERDRVPLVLSFFEFYLTPPCIFLKAKIFLVHLFGQLCNIKTASGEGVEMDSISYLSTIFLNSHAHVELQACKKPS